MSTLFNFSLLPKGDCRETGSFSPSHHGEGRVGARRLPLAICAIFLLGLAACKTDVDVNAPATERAVVYALLDPGATTHIVRVERAFLNAAEADVYKIVKNKDSVYYPTSERSRIQVTLIELLASGAPSQRAPILLHDTIISKDTGLFYAPDQVLFTTPPRTVLKSSFSYKVQVYNTVTKYKATGQTDMVAALHISDVPNDPTNDIILPLACTDPGCIRDFNTFGSGVQFNRAGNVARVQINILVPWRETAPNGDTAYRSLVWNFYPDAPQIPSAGLFSQQLRGDDAYALANLLLQNVDTTKDVVRTFHNFTITIATGNQIISDYIQTGKAYSPISQTRPFYSNVVGGLGVVGSRNQFSFTVKPDGGIVNLQRASNTGQPSRYAKLRFR